MEHRKPSKQELALIGYLIKKSGKKFPEGWQRNLLVKPMEDGGMGSLRLLPKGTNYEVQTFGKQITDYKFKDDDDVDVIVSLNVDQWGNLYELDIWKTDFSSLRSMPEDF